ncbi:hypothetical protein MKT17_000968 [Cronobacter sakazakii]|nr:hypothetical protein [Cronobacter sakazakii]EIX1762647.1 hypothetical protein [Cronobacter sakazakii]EIX6119810.1 hypothetical protein [Cronobacter sakazakii]EIX6209475.1 hypothetical protein [Cronobacter sakazakii]EJO9052840.1 hypothetical protein [Cronobacter sakazakii]
MSTISNERLEKLSEYDCADRYEVMSMATELLALRKEREKEESAVCPKCGNTGLADSGGVQPWGEPILIECDCTAPPAPDIADDSLPYDPQIAEYEQMMEAEQAQADTTAQQFESLAGKSVVPAGWKLVPIDPTDAMCDIGHIGVDVLTGVTDDNEYYSIDGPYAAKVYRAMIAAAPEPCK